MDEEKIPGPTLYFKVEGVLSQAAGKSTVARLLYEESRRNDGSYTKHNTRKPFASLVNA